MHSLQQPYAGFRGGEQWQSLWNTASTLDFELSRCKDDQGLMITLSSNDIVELGLRHLFAYVHENRTHGKVGVARLRAVAAPGSEVDITPA